MVSLHWGNCFREKSKESQYGSDARTWKGHQPVCTSLQEVGKNDLLSLVDALHASFHRSVPQWLKITSDEVKDQIFKLAKKGLTPSQIGVILRDSHGVAQVLIRFSFKETICTSVDQAVGVSYNLGDIVC